MENQELKKCRNCYYEVPKGIRRCPYCGIVNPTLEMKEIILGMVGVLIVMALYTFLSQAS